MINFRKRKIRGKQSQKKRFKNKESERTELSKLKYGSQIVYSRMSQGLLGKTFKTKLVYAERNFTLNPGLAGIVASHVFSANGVYDPDITGVGHQPSGFDQFMQFYDHFTVVASKIYVQYNNSDATNYQFAGVYVSDTASTEADYRVIVENGLGSYTMLGLAGSGNELTGLEMGVNVSKFMGRPSILSEDELRGTSISNPADQCYFHVWGAPNNTVDTALIGFTVRIEYVVIFTEPNKLPIS